MFVRNPHCASNVCVCVFCVHMRACVRACVCVCVCPEQRKRKAAEVQLQQLAAERSVQLDNILDILVDRRVCVRAFACVCVYILYLSSALSLYLAPSTSLIRPFSHRLSHILTLPSLSLSVPLHRTPHTHPSPLTDTLPHTSLFIRTLSHNLYLSHAHSHTVTHTHSLSHTLSYSHTHTLSLTHTLTLSLSHTHTMPGSRARPCRRAA